jgi:hypothetical protein
MGLAGLLRAAETDEGLTASFSGSEARADSVFSVHGDMRVEFCLEVGVGWPPVEEAAQALDECS